MIEKILLKTSWDRKRLSQVLILSQLCHFYWLTFMNYYSIAAQSIILRRTFLELHMEVE